MNNTKRVNTLCGKMKSFLDAFEKLRKTTVSCVMSVRPPAWNWAPIRRIFFMEFHVWVFFENQLRKFNLDLYLKRMRGTVQKGPIHIYDISLNYLLRMRNVSNKSVEKNTTHILCTSTFFRKSCRLWENVDKYCTATDDDMAHAFCIQNESINTHTEYVILTALPLQQWLLATCLSAKLHVHCQFCSNADACCT